MRRPARREPNGPLPFREHRTGLPRPLPQPMGAQSPDASEDPAVSAKPPTERARYRVRVGQLQRRLGRRRASRIAMRELRGWPQS
jgi:hypothetical protein